MGTGFPYRVMVKALKLEQSLLYPLVNILKKKD